MVFLVPWCRGVCRWLYKVPQTAWLMHNRDSFLTVLDGRSQSASTAGLGKAVLQSAGLHLLPPPHVEEEMASPLASAYKDTESCPLITPQWAHLQIRSHLGLNFNPGAWGHSSIQFITTWQQAMLGSSEQERQCGLNSSAGPPLARWPGSQAVRRFSIFKSISPTNIVPHASFLSVVFLFHFLYFCLIFLA